MGMLVFGFGFWNLYAMYLGGIVFSTFYFHDTIS